MTNNIQQGMRRARSLSQEDIESPFESFNDYVKRQPPLSMFAQLRQDTEPDSESSPPKAENLFNSIPIIPVDESIKQRQRRSEVISVIAKVLVLIITLLIILLIFYKQNQWQVTLTKYRSQITPTKGYPPQYNNILYLKQYQQIQNIQAHHPTQPTETHHNLSYYMNLFIKKHKQPKPYRDIDGIAKKELPFCVYVHEEDSGRRKKIVDSVLENQYGNYAVVMLQTQSQHPANETYTDERIKKISHKNHSYFYLKSILIQTCPKNSLLLFIDSPIQHQTLHKFNHLHQNWNMYLTYSQTKNVIQLHTFYIRIFELLDINDFDHSNREELDKGNLQLMAMGMLELCILKSKNINIEGNFIHKDRNVLSYLLVNADNQKQYKRTAYNGVTRLSQDFYINLLKDRLDMRYMHRMAEQHKQIYIQNAKLSIQKMQQALQLQNIIYLPRNHSLLTRQLDNYDKLYNTKQYLNKQLPFCIAILSHNNIPHNRYIKVMLSVLRQEYSNYRIVFFDDMSSDETFNRTIEYMNGVGFERITYVRNLERKYATYNLLNAGFNFCRQDQIQVLLDGDDELIGAYVLALINGLYQKYPQKWVIYTNFKSNLYEFGQSKPIPSKLSIVANNSRVPGHRLGQLRTFKVKLLRMIPKKYHQTQSGYWLDTVYDDALGHSLFQLATFQRVMYVPQICYEYNRQYGDNDDSSQQKVLHRSKVYEYLLGLPPLNQVKDLQAEKVDKEMLDTFQKQMRSKTFEIVLPNTSKEQK